MTQEEYEAAVSAVMRLLFEEGRFTTTDKVILDLVAHGWDFKTIAKTLGISEKSLYRHRMKILQIIESWT